METLQIYAVLPRTRALGPGERFALWVQGCRRSCDGCMTPDARPMREGTEMEAAELAGRILQAEGIEGITISGGEPFLQAEALAALVDRVRTSRDLGVIVYSGYTLAELRAAGATGDPPAAAALLDRIDLLIDGPYQPERDDGGRLRGSANQRVHPLTGRYAEAAAGYGAPGRAVEFHLLEREVMLAGIPGPDALARWRSGFRGRGGKPETESR